MRGAAMEEEREMVGERCPLDGPVGERAEPTLDHGAPSAPRTGADVQPQVADDLVVTLDGCALGSGVREPREVAVACGSTTTPGQTPTRRLYRSLVAADVEVADATIALPRLRSLRVGGLALPSTIKPSRISRSASTQPTF